MSLCRRTQQTVVDLDGLKGLEGILRQSTRPTIAAELPLVAKPHSALPPEPLIPLKCQRSLTLPLPIRFCRCATYPGCSPGFLFWLYPHSKPTVRQHLSKEIPSLAQCEHLGFFPSQRIFFFRHGRHLQTRTINLPLTSFEGNLRLRRPFSGLRFLRA
jgi:hypothetical protein